jgi:hypothetical protein
MLIVNTNPFTPNVDYLPELILALIRNLEERVKTVSKIHNNSTGVYALSETLRFMKSSVCKQRSHSKVRLEMTPEGFRMVLEEAADLIHRSIEGGAGFYFVRFSPGEPAFMLREDTLETVDSPYYPKPREPQGA